VEPRENWFVWGWNTRGSRRCSRGGGPGDQRGPPYKGSVHVVLLFLADGLWGQIPYERLREKTTSPV